MAGHIEPIRFALIVFPFLALAISSVFSIYEYRKYGTSLVTGAVTLCSFISYLLCTYFSVILSPPVKETVVRMTGPKMEPHLFTSWQHFRDNTVLVLSEPNAYLPVTKQSVFLELAFNALSLIPFGIYLRYYFRLSFMRTTIASFCLSLFFELTQLSGLHFIYPRPYRLFNMNDLVTNILGRIIGFVVTPLLTFMLPIRRRMDELSYEKGETISLTRRLAVYLIDWTFLPLINLVAAIFLKIAFDSGAVTSHIWWLLLEVGVYFMIVPLVANGWALGKRIARTCLVEEGRGRISLKASMIRYGYLYFLFYGLSWLRQLLQQIVNSITNTALQMNAVFISPGILLLQGIFILNILLSFLRKKRILLYERASHTYTVSMIGQTKDDDSRNQSSKNVLSVL